MTTNTLRFRSILAGIVLTMVSTLCFAQFGGGPSPLTSPEIGPKGDVTFRIRAPDAQSVKLTSGGDIPDIPFGGGLDMKSSDGVWEITLESLESGGYRYSFNVDGVRVLDPSNRKVSESNRNAWSLFYMPGSEFMDTRSLPHGAVAEVHYYSTELEWHRRMHVYTPPGYQLGENAYPVLYLLHGAMDSDDSWSSVQCMDLPQGEK